MSNKGVSGQDSTDTYDSHIVPAETAARKEREGENYKQHAEFTDAEKQGNEIDTDGGYTVDKEGLVNNYAVEPEMYYEVPGDLKAEEQALAAQRSEELKEINETDETGKLTEEGDKRGKGTGII
jgi:hypothetical protein